MNSNEDLLGGLASGDTAPILAAEPALPLKREHDSTDDFEHLDRERRDEPGEVVHANGATSRDLTQSFLDAERDEDLLGSVRPPSLTENFADQLADKFTDSESDADTAGESPLHRAESKGSEIKDSIHQSFMDAKPLLEPVFSSVAPTPEPPVIASAPIVPPPALVTPLVPEKAPEPQPPVVKPAPKEPPVTKPAPIEPPVAKPTPKEPPRAPSPHVIEAEVIFCQMGLDAWFDPQRLHPKVESLIYWRDAAKSGAALGAGMALLVALACCSVVSVLAYAALLVLTAAVGFRIYKNVMQAVQKTNDGHPFKWLLEKDLSLPAEKSQALAATATAHLNAAVAELRRLFLVEDLVDSLKFGVLLWCLTYVGACFNGITLIILGWIALFTLPKAYEMNKAQVDANLELARAKINEISAKVRAAVPLGRKSESEKDK